MPPEPSGPSASEHAERSLAAIQAYFAAHQPAGVRAVYALGSAVTGDFRLGYSDLDLIILVDDGDATPLMRQLRAFNTQLLIASFHVHKPADFPPPDLYLQARLLSEGRLLYGVESRAALSAAPTLALQAQVLAALTHRLVMLRSLACSPALDTYAPGYPVYYALKFCLYGARADGLLAGDPDTGQRHVLHQALLPGRLPPANQAFLAGLLQRLDTETFPAAAAERLDLILGTVAFLETIQRRLQAWPG